MQYSRINLLNRPMIIDVREGEIIQSFVKTKSLPNHDEFDHAKKTKYIVYGAALHNEGCEEINHREFLKKPFAYPFEDGYKTLSIVDMYTISTIHSGGLTCTPFAALIETDTELDTEKPKISAFPKKEDMDIITNMLNRECVYAIEEIETRQEVLDAISWKSTIDDAHLLEVAMAIK